MSSDDRQTESDAHEPTVHKKKGGGGENWEWIKNKF